MNMTFDVDSSVRALVCASIVLGAVYWIYMVITIIGSSWTPHAYKDGLCDSEKSTSNSAQTNHFTLGIINIFGDLFITFTGREKAASIAKDIFFGRYVLVQLSTVAGAGSGVGSFPSSLAEIFRFYEMLLSISRHNPGNNIILCLDCDTYVQRKALFLCGCHLIMKHSFTSQQTCDAFKHLEKALPNQDTEPFTLSSCWTALYRAKTLRWIDFGNIFDVGQNPERIFIEEYIHYAR
jgi:hypothetical protein